MRIAPALLLLALAAGCAGTRPYSGEGRNNLTVRTAIERGVSATLHVHRVLADCATEYRGSVELDRPVIELALPADTQSYLVVSYDTSSFLGGSRSTNAATLLRPRAGQSYELAVSYRDAIYNLSLREGSASGRELPRRDLVTCRAG